MSASTCIGSRPGETPAAETGEREVCLVFVTGKAAVTAGGKDFGVLGERMSPFEGKPWSVYVPAGLDWSRDGDDRAGAGGLLGARRRRAAGAGDRAGRVGQETRGKGTNTRHVTNILPESRAGGFAAGGRGDHAGRPHVELSAAQARPRQPAATRSCSRRPTTTASTRRRALPSSASTPTTARSTRRWRSRTAT